MSPDKPLPADVNPPSKIEPTAPLGQDQKMREGQTSFEQIMKEPTAKTEQQRLLSPMELAAGQPTPTNAPSYPTLVSQVNSTQNTINDLRGQMQTPNLKLKQSQKYLLQNKLTEANANLRGANLKLGIEKPLEPTKPGGPTPIDKFIAYLTDGQLQLEAAHNQINNLNKSGTELSGSDFLQIQVKLNKAQQQLEYSSVLLSKAVEGMKTLFNVNL